MIDCTDCAACLSASFGAAVRQREQRSDGAAVCEENQGQASEGCARDVQVRVVRLAIDGSCQARGGYFLEGRGRGGSARAAPALIKRNGACLLLSHAPIPAPCGLFYIRRLCCLAPPRLFSSERKNIKKSYSLSVLSP